jgi:hypothetical protein
MSEVLKQPAAKCTLEVIIVEWQLIGIAKDGVQSLGGVVLNETRRVVDGDDVRRLLFGEPAATRTQIEKGAFAPEEGLVVVAAHKELMSSHDL